MDTVSQNSTARDTVVTTVKFPGPVWRTVRKLAIDQSTSAQQVCVDAIVAHLRSIGVEIPSASSEA